MKICLKTNKPTNQQNVQANKPTWTSCGRDAEPAVRLLRGAATVAAAAWHALEGSRSWPRPSWVYFTTVCCLCPLLTTLPFSAYSAAPGFILLLHLWVLVGVFSFLDDCSHPLTRKSPVVLQSHFPQGNFLSLR